MEAILNKKEFNDLYDNIMSKMTIAYSSLSALVAAVRDCNFELHLQAEREMIKHYFAFAHVNYARYLAYQQVYLRDLERKDHSAMDKQNVKLVHIEHVFVQILKLLIAG